MNWQNVGVQRNKFQRRKQSEFKGNSHGSGRIETQKDILSDFPKRIWFAIRHYQNQFIYLSLWNLIDIVFSLYSLVFVDTSRNFY